MTRQQAIEELTVSLSKWVAKWSSSVCETDAWESLSCYVGDDTDRLMAKAAVSVLEAVAEVQEYLKDQGEMKE